MNIAYFRKSNHTLDQTVNNILSLAPKQGWKVLGQADLPDNIGKMILICRTDWVKKIIEADHNLLGLLPCSVSVFSKQGSVFIGSGQAELMKAVAPNQSVADLAALAGEKIRELIHESAGVSELKPKNVKLYSTMSCPYCQMEKAWLEKNQIKHEVVYVDINQAAAEEMVKRTGQMGVPVTEITFEDGQPEIIVGFDQPKLETVLKVTKQN